MVELAGAAREEVYVKASWDQVYTNRKLVAYDLFKDEWRWWCKYQERQRVSSRLRLF